MFTKHYISLVMTLCVENDKAYFHLLQANPSFTPPTTWRICSFPHLCDYLNLFPLASVCVCVFHLSLLSLSSLLPTLSFVCIRSLLSLHSCLSTLFSLVSLV